MAMLVRLVFVFLPLFLLAVAHDMVLLGVVATPDAPAAIRLGLLATFLPAVWLQVRDEARGQERWAKAAARALGRLMLWLLVPAVIVAVVAATVVTLGGGSVPLTVGAGMQTVAIGVVAGVAWLVLFVALEPRFGTLSEMRSIVTMTKPVFLVTLPPTITFVPVVGAISSLVLSAGWSGVDTVGQIPHAVVFGGIEAVAGVVMVFAWTWIVRVYLGSSWFWVGAIVLLHSVAAGYRTHRWVVNESAGTLVSGPIITQTFDWLDALAPIAGLLLFLIFIRLRAASRGGDKPAPIAAGA